LLTAVLVLGSVCDWGFGRPEEGAFIIVNINDAKWYIDNDARIAAGISRSTVQHLRVPKYNGYNIPMLPVAATTKHSSSPWEEACEEPPKEPS